MKDQSTQQSNFSCVLKGEVEHLEQIKECILKEFVEKGLVTLVDPTYDKERLYILTEEEWKDYQDLKEREDKLMGYGYP